MDMRLIRLGDFPVGRVPLMHDRKARVMKLTNDVGGHVKVGSTTTELMISNGFCL